MTTEFMQQLGFEFVLVHSRPADAHHALMGRSP